MKPALIIVAGPNRAGKTTITEKLLRHDWIMTRNFHVRYVRK